MRDQRHQAKTIQINSVNVEDSFSSPLANSTQYFREIPIAIVIIPTLAVTFGRYDRYIRGVHLHSQYTERHRLRPSTLTRQDTCHRAPVGATERAQRFLIGTANSKVVSARRKG